MIEFRLRQAGYQGFAKLFTDEAIRLIYQHTQGYPRRIALLCHDALETVVMRDAAYADAAMINGLINQEVNI
jgi:type II secretory pathway predicted ATPase ExeA